jgi:hypothetical protein
MDRLVSETISNVSMNFVGGLKAYWFRLFIKS